MNAIHKGLILAALHLLLVSALAGKLLIDRATLPRVWVLTAPYDPELPIRGRYVCLSLEVHTRGMFEEVAEVDPERPWQRNITHSVNLLVEKDQLIAVPSTSENEIGIRRLEDAAYSNGVLSHPVAFFIPEHVSDPSRRPAGEELWVEVTIPKKGPPRPIRLGVKKDGVLTPLPLN